MLHCDLKQVPIIDLDFSCPHPDFSFSSLVSSSDYSKVGPFFKTNFKSWAALKICRMLAISRIEFSINIERVSKSGYV